MEPENKQKLYLRVFAGGHIQRFAYFGVCIWHICLRRILYLLLYRQETENKNLSGGKR